MTKTSAESIVQFRETTRSKIKRKPASAPAPTIGNVLIGTFNGFEDGQPLVDFPGNTSGKALQALTGVQLSTADIGRQVTLAFVDGNPANPVILNLLLNPSDDRHQHSGVNVKLDGETLLLTAQKEIVMRCGEASITLTAAGKVLLKGSYLLSRSSGYNKIKGAAVDIN